MERLVGAPSHTAQTLFRKLVTSLLLVSLTLAPLGTTFAQEAAPHDPGFAHTEPAPLDSPAPELDTDVPAVDEVVDPESEPLAEPPVLDEESTVEKMPGEPEPELRASEAGGAQATALSFQIPTQPQATIDQSTGALVYEYPVELQEGRNGMTPELSLRYNSRNITRPDSIAGLGWELSIPYIQREPVRGTQRLYAEPYFSSSLSGNLIATSDTSSTPYTSYRPESDDGDYLQYNFGSDSTWTVTGKNGETYTFGGSAASRQDDPSDSSKVYRWMVSKVADAHGNEIQYSYTKDQGQIYPSLIVYTYHASSPAVHTVSFAYTAPASYGSTVYNAAFPVTTARLLSTITVSTTVGPDTTTDIYSLSYSNAQFLKQKLLDSIQRTTNFAVAEYNQQTYSGTTSFTYSTKAPGWEQGAHSLASYLPYIDESIFQDIYTADFDLNGFPDVLVSTKPTRNPQQNYLMLNNGTVFTESWAAWSLPNHDVSTYHAIVDVNGDNLPDLHPRFTQYPDVYLNTGSGFVVTSSNTWKIGTYVSEAATCGPNVGDWLTYGMNAFLHDMDGDGKNDIVYFGGTNDFRVWLNNGDGWIQSSDYDFTAAPGASFTITPQCGSGGTGNHWQALLDLNGDSLKDYVHETYGTYLNTGAGFAFSAAYALDTQEMKRSGLADINGDGLIDLIAYKTYAGNRYSLVRMNSGTGWTLVNLTSFPPGTNTNLWIPNDLKYGSNYPETFGTLMDVTADGYPDIVGASSQSVTGRVRAISDGRSAWVANATYQDPWTPVITPSYGVFFDINADGAMDFITPLVTWDGKPQAASKVHMGKAAVPNRLVQITSPLFAQTVAEYGTAPTD